VSKPEAGGDYRKTTQTGVTGEGWRKILKQGVKEGFKTVREVKR